MSRAKRRQKMREAGYRRSPRKRGRRAPTRDPRPEPQDFETLLRERGFIVARPRLHVE